MNYKMRRETP